MVIDRVGKGPNLNTIENMRKFMTGKAKEKDTTSVKADKGDQDLVHHRHHPGLLQEAVQLHGQEDPAAGVGCQPSTESL
jgi:hypothetical protein